MHCLQLIWTERELQRRILVTMPIISDSAGLASTERCSPLRASIHMNSLCTLLMVGLSISTLSVLFTCRMEKACLRTSATFKLLSAHDG